MQLKELLLDIYPQKIDRSWEDYRVQSIECDSRKVNEDSLFIALPGASQNGAQYIPEAIHRGARVIVTSEKPNGDQRSLDVCYLCVQNPNLFLRDIVRKFYGDPSARVGVIGITGTNGKTTTTFLIESILKIASKSCAVVGTINIRIGEKVYQTNNTTPGLLDNQKLLHGLSEDRIDYCVMEVSSHALAQGRVDLIDFKVAVFTNLTSDHLDYHRTREEYFKAKAKLFIGLSAEANAIINGDDAHGVKLTTMTEAKVTTYGIDQPADVTIKDVVMNVDGSRCTVVYPSGKIEIKTPLIGKHNMYNILAAFTTCWVEGIPVKMIKEGIESLANVPGRLQRIKAGQKFSVLIDYAHTEDALENVLTTIRPACQGRIILVFGCGGDRDKTKRPKMGEVASRLADHSIVTSDNPRSEDPQSIIDGIVQGFKKDNFTVIVEREEAIRHALKEAQNNDVILIAGKGHETYQIFKDRTIEFNEQKIIENILNPKR